MEISRFWHFFLKRYWILAVSVLGLSIITLLFTLVTRPVYRNSATIWIDPKAILAEYVGSTPGTLGKFEYIDNESYIDTFEGILGSKSTIQDVINRLNIKDGKGRPITPEKFYDPGIITLYLKQKKGVKVDQLNDSELLEITGYSTDIEEATAITEAVLDSFLKTFYNLNKDEARKAIKAIKGELDLARASWEKAEAERKNFMKSNDIVIFDSVKANVVSKMAGYENELYALTLSSEKAKKNLSEISGKLKALPEYQTGSMTEDLNTLVISYKNQLMSILLDTEGKLAELTDEHPEVKVNRRKIDEAKRKIKEEAERVVSTKVQTRSALFDSLMQKYIDSELEVALNEVAYSMTKSQLEKYKREAKRINDLDTEYTSISIASQTTYNHMSSLTTKYQQAMLAERLDVANAVVIDRPAVPAALNMKNYKAFPSRSKMLLITVFLAFLAGFTIMVFVDSVDQRCLSREDLSSFTGGRVLGSVPFDSKISLEPSGRVMKAVRNVVSAIKLGANGQGGKVMVPVFSLEPGEGRTTFALACAKTLSSDGLRTVIADLDATNAGLSRSYGLESSVGVYDYLAGKADLKACLNRRDGVDVIPAGETGLSDPARMDGLARLAQELRQSFDAIIFDLPSLSSCPASVDMLGAIGSEAVVIVKYGADRDKIERVARTMRQAEFVLNFSRHGF